MIIIYIDDEREGAKCGNLFAERGFDNIYLLSGGFEEFAAKFPHLLDGKKAAVYQGKMVVKPVSPKKVAEKPMEGPRPAPKPLTEKITDINPQLWGKGKLVKTKEVAGKITGECHLDRPGRSSKV